MFFFQLIGIGLISWAVIGYAVRRRQQQALKPYEQWAEKVLRDVEDGVDTDVAVEYVLKGLEGEGKQ